jgi:two-component SAPR family response regulator
MTTSSAGLSEAVLEAMPYGIVVVDRDARVVHSSPAAREFLPALRAASADRCDELFHCQAPGGPCEQSCLAQRAAGSLEPLPEVRIDTLDGAPHGALWVTAAPMPAPQGAVLHLRPGRARDRRRRSEPQWDAGPELTIRAFGRTQVTSGQQSLNGDWLSQRAGQILKYMLCVRHRIAMAEEIAEAIWPDSGREALSNTRHVMHRLRDRLEPDRRPHTESSFVRSAAGGYVLDLTRVRIDVDAFERAVEEGTSAFDRLEHVEATRQLEAAVALYTGDFLADEPYAEWAFEERSRLSGLAEYALRLLIVMAFGRDDPSGALKHLERLAALEPLDSAVHRELIATLISLGRRSEAKRRYMVFAKRMRREFGEDPEFDLVSSARGGPSVAGWERPSAGAASNR